MNAAMFQCPALWARWLPGGIRRPRSLPELEGEKWDILALTASGWERPPEIRCNLLLLPGDCQLEALQNVRMARAVSYGLSPRDSLTYSSLRQPVLCVQRALPRPDGGIVEPQEIPLPTLPAPPERMLPLLGLRLLFLPVRKLLSFLP